jgi:Zn-dependent protease
MTKDEQFGFRVGRAFGVDIYIRPAWLFVFGLLVYMFASHMATDEDFATLRQGAIYFLATATSICLYITLLAHEFGHALAARHFGIKTRRISVHFFGAATHTEREARTPGEEFWITVWGPLVSLLCAVLFGALALVAHFAGGPGYLVEVLGIVSGMNVFLFIINLAPGLPLDGGRILRSIVWRETGSFLQGTKVASAVGRVIGSGMIGLGLIAAIGYQSFDGVIFVMLGWFMIRLSRHAIMHAELLTSFEHLTVRDLMRPIDAVIPADALASEASQGFFEKYFAADWFPVVRDHHVLGFVNRQAIGGLEPRQMDWVRVTELVSPFSKEMTIAPDVDAFSAFVRFNTTREIQLPVFENKQLVGILREVDLTGFLNAKRLAMSGQKN